MTATYSQIPGKVVSAANGVDYAYRATGDGTVPLLFLQHFRGNLDNWDPALIDDLAATRRVVTFDNRGIGASPITPGPYRIADLAEDAHALHQALGLAPCLAIGSSMGGAISQEWALRYPADVAGVVLSNTWGRSDAFLRVLFEHWISLAGKGR